MKKILIGGSLLVVVYLCLAAVGEPPILRNYYTTNSLPGISNQWYTGANLTNIYTTNAPSWDGVPSQGSNLVNLTYVLGLPVTVHPYTLVGTNLTQYQVPVVGAQLTNLVDGPMFTDSEGTNVYSRGIIKANALVSTNTISSGGAISSDTAPTQSTNMVRLADINAHPPGNWGEVHFTSNNITSGSTFYFTNNTLSLGHRSVNNYDWETYGASGTWQLTRPDATGSAGLLFAESTSGTAKALIANRGASYSTPASQANNLLFYNFVNGGEFTFHCNNATRTFGINTNDVYGRVPFSSSVTPTQLTNFVRLQELRFRPISAGGNVTLTSAHYHYDINVTSGMATLPDASTVTGKEYIIGMIAPATSGCLTNGGGQKITLPGGSYDAIVFNDTNSTVRIMSDGAVWRAN